jgi:hypothetical protein
MKIWGIWSHFLKENFCENCTIKMREEETSPCFLQENIWKIHKMDEDS